LTSRRGIGTAYLEEAVGIGNRLHARFEEEANRRAREETERLRREAEQRAADERERELARAEAEAVKLEEGAAELSGRERTFVDLYTSQGRRESGNAQNAATAAGFRDPLKSAARLISLPKIQKAIEAVQQAAAIRRQATARREAPLEVDAPQKVVPMVTRAANTSTRTYHSAVVTDKDALVAAVISGKHGIPWDVLTFDQSKVNEYARSLEERINAWPGVQHKKETKIQ
jgi:hypothetical protein